MDVVVERIHPEELLMGWLHIQMQLHRTSRDVSDPSAVHKSTKDTRGFDFGSSMHKPEHPITRWRGTHRY
jgi:hypothetical protein